jgi:GT2 family glycosyltransferase
MAGHPMTRETDLSIIVVNYNTMKPLLNCLSSIRSVRQSLTVEVIIVDNASNDWDADKAARAFPGVRILESRENTGFSAGSNAGYRMAVGRHVMTLNPDAELQAGCLEALVGFLDTHGEAGLAAPLTFAQDGSLEPTWGSYGAVATPLTWRRFFPRGISPPREPASTNWIWGTGYVCPRSALGDGFFEEETFLFGEEHRLCRRLRSAGRKLYVVPRARITHRVGVSYRLEPTALSAVRRLWTAVVWQTRREVYGTAAAVFSQAVTALDSLVLLGFLAARDLLPTGDRGPRRLARVDCRARIAASLGVLLRGASYIRAADAEVRRLLCQPGLSGVTGGVSGVSDGEESQRVRHEGRSN